MLNKKRVIIGTIAAFIFAVIVFTVIFISVLDSKIDNGMRLASDPTTTQSSYAILSAGDLGSTILIVATTGLIVYFIFKA